MKLSELGPYSIDVDVLGISTNSKTIKTGELFICSSSPNFDRFDFIDEAIANGAVAVIASKNRECSVPVIIVDDPDQALADICNSFYQNPLDNLKLIGVTGTDGKTTTACIIQQLIGVEQCAYIGTNGIIFQNNCISTVNTTPSIDILYYYFNLFVTSGIKIVVLEVSSEAMFYQRLRDIQFDVSILTNFSIEHLNTHKTLDNYRQCKQKLFQQTKKTGYCILNADDQSFEDFGNISNGNVVGYGTKTTNFQINNIEKQKFFVNNQLVNTNLYGLFNVYNLTAAIVCLKLLGFVYSDFFFKTVNLRIEGRMQFIPNNLLFDIVIDFAHTPSSMLAFFKFFTNFPHNKIITVNGAPGERDKDLRAQRGKVASDYSDFVIFTSDDPRYENIESICQDLTQDIIKNNYKIIVDRKTAVITALNMARKNDLVLLIGMGHEKSILINGESVPYSDYQTVQDWLES